MNVLWVFAHPQRRSLNGSLHDAGVAALVEAGHNYQVSDLYAMKWKAPMDWDDFGGQPEPDTGVGAASRHAFEDGTLSADIRAEQDKLAWADAVVFQFPLWWYGMPAILKGWFDRVFVKGYAYGVPDPEYPGRSLRYGDGVLAGKPALVLLTTGSPAAAMGPRGINGQLDQVLFPLLHGTLWYVGMRVLPPVAIYHADRMDAEQHAAAVERVRAHASTIADTPPLDYRHQNHGDYDDELVLWPGLAAGQSGLGVHLRSQEEIPSATQ